MMPAFPLSHLVRRYLRSLAPLTSIKEQTEQGIRNVLVPVTERYDRILKLLENKSDAVQKYREELMGSSTEFDYSDTYAMIGLGKDIVGSYEELYAMLGDPYRVRTAAKLIARHQLSNMVELVQRHDMLQRQKLEKLQNKGKK